MKDVRFEPLLGNVILFCDKYGVQIMDVKDAYYKGISRRRGSHFSNVSCMLIPR